MKVSLSNWYPGSGVGLIVSIPDLWPLSYFHVFPRDNIRKAFTLCITQSLKSQIHFHLLYWIASFCIYTIAIKLSIFHLITTLRF